LASDAVLPWALVIYALCIQIRLLCNMLDGMVAVEHQMGSPVGELYNEVPDRIADVLFLASFGYLSTIQPLGHVLGWSAAALALGSAYIRALGGQLVGGQDFGGILAKPRRMFLLTVGAGLCALALWSGLPITWIVLTTLGLLTLGSGVTVIQRLRRLAAQLRQQE
jgi:phosphatidylglycerophosphate synthase